MEGSATPNDVHAVALDIYQDMDIWMSDGNVIIAAVHDAEDTKATYYFRCHKSVLSNHSVVFRDMFSLPQGAGTEVYDGLPVVALPDKYKDVKTLLQMVYDHSGIPEISTDIETWPDDLNPISSFGGVLCLTAKYMFTNLHERLAAVFRFYFPTKLEQWDRRQKLLASAYDKDKDLVWPTYAELIDLASRGDVTESLPVIFYLLNTRAKPTCQGVEFLDNFNPEEDPDELMQTIQGLSAPHLCQLLEGREWLRLAANFLMLRALPMQIPDCTQSVCNASLAIWWASMYKTYSAEDMLFFDPLKALRHLEVEAEKVKSCYRCNYALNQALEASRKYLWEELPYFFRLKTRNKTEKHLINYYMEVEVRDGYGEP